MSISDAFPQPGFRPFVGAGFIDSLFPTGAWPTIGDPEETRGEPVDRNQPFVPIASATAAIGACSDAALLAAIAEGRCEAFQAFYERFGGRVLSYARQLVGGHSERTEDLAQRSFWRSGARRRVSMPLAVTPPAGCTPSPAIASSTSAARRRARRRSTANSI